jgi:hypothetical protein
MMPSAKSWVTAAAPSNASESAASELHTLAPTPLHTPDPHVLGMHNPYTYSETLAHAGRVAWRLEDVLRDEDRLDFSAPFLPDSLADTASVAALTQAERRSLNQLRGYSYLCLFGLVEEFILPFLLDHARSRIDGEDAEIRALLQFAGEEAKHIELFRRFAQAFERQSSFRPGIIGPGRDIADAVLEHSQLGVALVVLHIEWMTQRHYVDSVKSETAIDPLFKRLLHHHWLEEAQHAKLDTLIVHKIASQLRSAEIQQGLHDYERILRLFTSGLERQAELDLEMLERVIARELPTAARAELLSAQRRSYHSVFIASGTNHPNFRRTLTALAAA